MTTSMRRSQPHTAHVGVPCLTRAPAANGSAGDTDCAETIDVVEKFDHPSYNDATLENDISLLRLSQTPACLSSIDLPILDDGTHSQGGETCTVAGWGATSEGGSSSSVLKSVDLALLSKDLDLEAWATMLPVDNGCLTTHAHALPFRHASHVVASYNGTGVSLYLDGVLVLSKPAFLDGVGIADRIATHAHPQFHLQLLSATAGVSATLQPLAATLYFAARLSTSSQLAGSADGSSSRIAIGEHQWEQILPTVPAADAQLPPQQQSAATTSSVAARPHAHEPTPDLWKDMPEKKKRDYLLRNYGIGGVPPPASHPSPPLQPPRAAPDDRYRRAPFLDGAATREETPLLWKEWPEKDKRAFITRNYGARAIATGAAPPSAVAPT